MEKVNILILSLSIMTVILIGILVFLSFNFLQGITGEVVVNQYSYTKAVCNETNYCEDYEIACRGEEIVSMTFTGAAVQNLPDWEDPRSQEVIDRLC